MLLQIFRPPGTFGASSYSNTNIISGYMYYIYTYDYYLIVQLTCDQRFIYILI